MVDNLDWTGKGAFRAAGSREWKVDGAVAGLVRSGGGLTFVTLDGAGHLVCPFLILWSHKSIAKVGW